MIFQIGSALLDACVLATLYKGDAYGYVLTQNVKEVMDISESTLYPVLRRLQKDEFVSTYDMSHNGRTRRYYKISSKGEQQLHVYREGWNEYKIKIDKILGEE